VRSPDQRARECDRGEIASCTLLGLIYETGAAGMRDRFRALALYTRACDFGAEAACRRLALAQAAPPPAPEGDRFVRTGHVADAETGGPIVGAVVELPRFGIRVLADETGRVDIGRLPRGRHRVIVARLGYVTVEGLLPVPWETEFLMLLEPAANDE
jgi:hypothetical protein